MLRVFSFPANCERTSLFCLPSPQNESRFVTISLSAFLKMKEDRECYICNINSKESFKSIMITNICKGKGDEINFGNYLERQHL